MRDGAEHVKDEFAAQQRDPAFFQRGDGREQFGQRAPMPVEAYHSERVASSRKPAAGQSVQVRVIEAPPSTSEAVPVTKLESSEAR